MRAFYGCYPLYLTVSLTFSAFSSPTETLTVGWLNDNVNERYLISDIEQEFAKVAPDITLNAVGVHTDKYKQQVVQWLNAGEGPDVLYWYGDERLRELVRNEWVSDISDIWHAHQLNDAFRVSVSSQVSLDGRFFAIPVSHYPWSFFYNAELFDALGFTAPNTWEEFLLLCQALKEKGITPIAIGYDAPWVLTSWLEFISLRLYGESFHNELLSGRVSYKDERVIQVFRLWKVLIDKGYFMDTGENMNWYDPMPYLYRGLAGVTLIGYFLSSRIPESVEAKIRTFSFPELNHGQETIELAPLDVFFIRASSPKQKAARRFLTFMATHKAQSRFNLHAGGFSPLEGSEHVPNYFNDMGTKQLNTAEGTSPYFDRVVPNEFATSAMTLLKDFMKSADVASTTDRLEALRLEVYKLD
ncbi:ABC transporter substrate-binding protein [Alteromonas gracilis]|uniref:ABC transporter substrate-binding protein n=1 Tax=Alteromonas gracilis TaxID=1479524 RepID=UPI003735761A